MNRQVVVENRGGANGIIGTEVVARAPADGYTLLFVSSPHSVNPSLYQKLPYDTLRDFAPVSMVATSPYLLVVHPSLPVRNVKELIETLNAEVHKTMRLPGAVDAMRGMGVDIALSTPEEFGRLIESEMQRWGKVIRALNLKVQ